MAHVVQPDAETIALARKLVTQSNVPEYARRAVSEQFWNGFGSNSWFTMTADEQIRALADWLHEHGHRALEVKSATPRDDVMDRAIVDELAETRREVGELRERMDRGFDRGTWKNGSNYQRGQWVTDHGSLWICQENTADRPGASAAWRLAVKKGSAER